MDFTKFVTLLESRRLFFSRIDRLNDPFEGSWPIANVQGRKKILEYLPESAREVNRAGIERMGEITKQWNGCSAVNCWHLNDDESAAMWSTYLRSGDGIAIRSTYSRLKESFTTSEEVYIGMVKYIDYEKDSVPTWNMFEALVHKRRSYEHEREVRALVFKPGEKGDLTKSTIIDGLSIEVDLSVLIDRIYIAPGTASWFASLVKDVIGRYGYAFEVKQSRLDDAPVY